MADNTPLDLKQSPDKPLSIDTLSNEQFDGEIEKGMADLAEDRVVSSDDVTEKMSRSFQSVDEMAERILK